ncbi:MAG: carboxypeptidase-like regulatory domain-containing protein, partial [Rhodothermales bacterium]
FRVGDLPAGSYVLTARREGYVATTDSVTVVVGDIVERVMRMDGMPRVDRFDVRSAHISRWWPPPQELYRLEVTAEVSDPDGISDIDRVWIEVPEVGLVDTLVASGTPGQFLSILQEASLPVGVESLLGHDHVIHVRDRAGYELVSSARKIARVIDATPVASTPTSLATLIDPAPRFNWEPLRMPYPYTYRLDIVRVDENIQTVVQLLENIPADSVSLKIPTPLLSGEYFWTVSVVDEFGNRSRSREAGFRIQ